MTLNAIRLRYGLPHENTTREDRHRGSPSLFRGPWKSKSGPSSGAHSDTSGVAYDQVGGDALLGRSPSHSPVQDLTTASNWSLRRTAARAAWEGGKGSTEVEDFSKSGDWLEIPLDRSRPIPWKADPIGTLDNSLA